MVGLHPPYVLIAGTDSRVFMNLIWPPHSLKRTAVLALSVICACATSGCATRPDRNPDDPLENVNRVTYQFNDVLDRTIAKPAAKAYNAVTPSPVRTMVNNFFSNIGDATVMANDLLQGHVTDGTEDLMRIVMNTFLGIGGLVDFATPAGLPKHDQDFGLTLGHWGVPMGPYVVLPLFGPSDFRDAVGFAVDLKGNPTGYLRPAVRNALFPLNFVSARARYLGATDLLSAAALDKYSFTRDAYLGRRKYQLTGGNDSAEALPDYGSDAAPATPAAEHQPGNHATGNAIDNAPGNAALKQPDLPASAAGGGQ